VSWLVVRRDDDDEFWKQAHHPADADARRIF